MEQFLQNSRAAFLRLSTTTTEYRNDLLGRMEKALQEKRGDIEAANELDLNESKALASEGKLNQTLVDRLKLSGSKFDGLMTMVSSVAKLEDPLGRVTYSHNMLEDGSLSVHRVSCPIGVIAIIFESRPEAAVQIASLCIKSGNAVVLKGGKEARRTVRALVDAMRSVEGVGDAVQMVESREDISALLAEDKYVDLIIPRGGADLVRYCKKNTVIPVLGHADGICAVYVDKEADRNMAVDIVVDAKTQYPAVCNAAETLLVHKDVAEEYLPVIAGALIEKNVSLRVCPESFALLDHMHSSLVTKSSTLDYKTEYCDLILAVKIVDSLEGAIDHINTNGSHHSECIVTANPDTAEIFMNAIDSADVMWNASTRFADGNRFGFGAEVGVSTNKIHARGPVGLEGLTTYKYRVIGTGNTVGKDGASLVPVAAPNKNVVRVDEINKQMRNMHLYNVNK
jgi:glutamate-5-semialdehyde dehydrogenase